MSIPSQGQQTLTFQKQSPVFGSHSWGYQAIESVDVLCVLQPWPWNEPQDPQKKHLAEF